MLLTMSSRTNETLSITKPLERNPCITPTCWRGICLRLWLLSYIMSWSEELDLGLGTKTARGNH